MVAPLTVRAWASKGELKASTARGGRRRFFFADVEEFALANNLTFNIEHYDELRIPHA